MANIEELERQIALLSPVEREKLFSKFEREPQTQCRSITTSELKAQLAEKRFAGGTFCPFCGARHVVRAGRQADGSQRYLCKSCGRRFQSTSATLLKNGVSPELLQVLKRYVHCMCLELPIRQTARECGISSVTAFYWRHKILDALSSTLEKEGLQGVIEADETFFRLSFKGRRQRKLQIKGTVVPLGSHKRGGATTGRRGLGRDQVCVPIAISRAGGFVGKVSNFGTPNRQDLANVLSGRFTSSEVVVTDGGRPYQRVAREENITLVQIKGGKGKHGNLNIQSVNAFHSGLKGFVNSRCKGVATKYLNNYVAWYGFLHALKKKQPELEDLLLGIAQAAVSPAVNRDLSSRDAVPILSQSQRRILGWLLIEIKQHELEERRRRLEEDAAKLQALNGASMEEDVPF